MRVLLVSDYAPGAGFGAEVHLSLLFEGLKEAGDSVEVYTRPSSSGGSKLLDVWNPAARKGLASVAERFRPDVIHFHNILRELSPSVFTASDRAPRVLTVNDYRILGIPDGSAWRPVDGFAMRSAKRVSAGLARSVARRAVDAVIAPNLYLAGLLREHGMKEVHWIPHFTHPGPEPVTKPSSSDDVLFVGRLGLDKGVQVLLDAFVGVADRFPRTRLLLAGDGPDRALFEASAKTLPAGRVEFLGLLPNEAIRSSLDQVRLLAVPSLMQEVGPLVAIEAAFAGRPIVASEDPGLRELLKAGDFGLLVARGDIAALAEALSVLLEDPARCDRMGEAARRVGMRTWTVEAGISKTREVYKRAVEVHGSRALGRRS